VALNRLLITGKIVTCSI